MAEPIANIRFQVRVGNNSLGSWSKCEGLSVEYEVFEYQEGGLNDYVHRLPGRRKYPNVRLTRIVSTDSKALKSWLSELATEVKRQHAEITVLDAAGEVVCSWGLTDAYPVKWTGPSLDAGGRQVAFETLELAHNGFLEG